MFRFLTLLCALVLQSSALVLNAPLPQGRALTSGLRAEPAAMMAKKEGKKLTVLLEKPFDGLGSAGDLVDVKPAYAENFLVAKGYGVVASTEIIEQKAAEKAAAEAALVEAKKTADASKEMLNAKFGKGLTYDVQVSKEGTIDPVTSVEIANEIKRAGVDVAPEAVAMDDITELGSSLVEVALHPEVTMTFKVNVEKSKITFS